MVAPIRRAVPVAALVLSMAPAALGYQGPAYPYGPYGQPPGAYGQMPPQVQYGPLPPAGPYGQYRPMAPDNARGVAPPPAAQPSGESAGQMPGYRPVWPGAYAPPAQAQPSAAPRLEWSVDDTQPYVQQHLLLRLDLFSPEPVTSAEPQIPASNDVLIQPLSGPTAGYRTGQDGRREPATSFVLTLTPLRAGAIELPRLELLGTRSGGYGEERFRAVADRPVRLQVRPAMPSVRPWLPLKSLTLRAAIDRPPRVDPGQPVTLVLELAAVGGGASQLPSLEEQVVSPDFRIYREQTLTDTRLAADGRELEGKRTEYYTLVPQTGGHLRLPEISVDWWDLSAGTRQTARLPIRTLEIAGEGGPSRWRSSIVAAGSGLGGVWMPFAAILLVLSGYWAGIFLRRRRLGDAPGIVVRLRGGLRQAAGLTRTVAGRLHPAPLAGRLRRAFPAMLPQSSRLLRCLRQADRAATPEDWCARFEVCARRWLRGAGQDPVPRLAERILVLRPGADRVRVIRLMEQLDAALYGRQDIDFPRWKRDLMRQVGRLPRQLRARHGETRVRRARLPELNPRSA